MWRGKATQISPQQLLSKARLTPRLWNRCALATSSPPPESFIAKNSPTYLDEMYYAWKQNPESVHKSWQAYFKLTESGVAPEAAFQVPPTLRNYDKIGKLSGGVAGPSTTDAIDKEIQDHLKVQLLVRAFQVRGHTIAKLDPLEFTKREIPNELKLETYGFTEADLNRTFKIGTNTIAGVLSHPTPIKLGDLYKKLQDIYCGTIGLEYMHIQDREKCNWIREKFENRKPLVDAKTKEVILDRLLWADNFEQFTSSKFKSEKRFGLDGCESLIPGMKAMIDHAAELGVSQIVMGMAHRGRLNVLSNVVRKPFERIFNEFSGGQDPTDSFSGDVKYHLGMTFDRPTRFGKPISIRLLANPSHLEAVNPVVMGETRALQFYTGDTNRDQNVAVLLHGDASFAGQGVVYESLGLTNLPGYTTGGVAHIVINNQIGFTTDPKYSRSTDYCTDVATALQAPILHVNGDDPEAVTFACELAIEWRQKFKSDVVVDIVCYRRYGHNEVDQPAFTQPLLYELIGKKKRAVFAYRDKLLAEGAIQNALFEELHAKSWKVLEEAYKQSQDVKHSPDGWTSNTWMVAGFPSPEQIRNRVYPIQKTGVDKDLLRKVGEALCFYPEDFNIHNTLRKITEQKLKTVQNGTDIDMPTAEALAFGTLLLEGYHVRLSGQDVERGTFSQRHSVLIDQKNETRFIPLNNLQHISPEVNQFDVFNSSLSEYGVLGYELGYSLANPNSLILWEAQFGDFANTAQCIIDQFIVSGESKWLQRSGLVMLLPHGYDGAGPEHSSGRMERFLQMVEEHPHRIPENLDEKTRRQIQDANIQVCYPSTPASYFHMLRRQVRRDFRKPLIIFTSKSLLRHPKARSAFDEMGPNTRFHRVIADDGTKIDKPENVQKLVFCSGQVYYFLDKYRDEKKITNTAITRLEQISPFPFDKIIEEIQKYPNAEIIWAQEEPMNAGAWSYVEPRVYTVFKKLGLRSKDLIYAGRDPSASTATGNKKQNEREEAAILHDVFERQ